MILAHGGLFTHALGQWTWEPVTVVLLVASSLVYARGVTVLWARAGRGQGITRWEAGAFALGLFTLALALLSPLAWLSDVLFSAHMTQHEILMLVSAPLFCFGRPVVAALWAMPRQWRERSGQVTRRRDVSAVWRTLTSPLSAFLIHAVVLWVWHIPVLFEAALRDTGIHALQHLSFLLTAALFWWGMIHGRYGRIGYGVAVLYVFLTAVHSSVLGALLTIAPTVWYPWYSASALTWQVSALNDQQLAGLLMWVPSGVIFIVLGLALFAAWLGESERRAALGTVPTASPGARGAH
ncbi:MAG TPA: cytochrome c oxidase assembly protein [Vicinamibacterales bacterium]|nr:cytochrome c oxidase assembly protein [Vicinamibacterales bacterium]